MATEQAQIREQVKEVHRIAATLDPQRGDSATRQRRFGRLRKRLQAKPRVLSLLDALFANPYMSVGRAEKILNVTNPTARHAVRTLLEHGLLEEITGRAWGRLYLARPILRAIEGSEGTT